MGDIHAVSIVAVANGRFLLVRRGRPPASGYYAFPGGKVESGETDEEAAQRELMEETNLSAAGLTALDPMILHGDNGKRYRLAIFLAAKVTGTLQAADDAASAGWYTLEEMRALPVTESALAVAMKVFEAAGAEMPLVVPGDPGKMSG